MHQTRAQTTSKLPISRKGTQYVVRALSHRRESVPALIAVRDMLHLASTAREVREMIKEKLLKINGKIVEDTRESIKLFNIFEAGKTYRLILLPTNKFALEEVAKNEARLCRVVNKKLLNKNVIQLNLHDGTNIISKAKIAVGDSVYLDHEGKVKSHVAFDKGKKAFILSGKYAGSHAVIKSIKESIVSVSLDNGGSADLEKSQLVVL